MNDEKTRELGRGRGEGERKLMDGDGGERQ